MKLLFVDTAGWMACADASDPAHRRAVAIRDAWLEGGGSFVTSERELKLREALTTDHHFVQAGFGTKP
jgi:predicted nucleic acid-binding protein